MTPKIISSWGSRNALIPGYLWEQGQQVPRALRAVLSPKCNKHPQLLWLWERKYCKIPSGNGLELEEWPQEFPGIPGDCAVVPGPDASTCFRSCYISPSPPCSLFTSVWASLGHNSRGSDIIWDIAASSSLLSPRPGNHQQHLGQKFLLQPWDLGAL